VGSTPSTPGTGLALEAGLGFRLSRLARILRRDWVDELSALSLTPPQAAVLRGVAGSPGCSLRALARRLETDPMNAKRCVDELEQRDLVHSAHRSGDRRPRTLTLSNSGRMLADRVDVLVRGQEHRLYASLGPVRLQRFEAAITRLESTLLLRRDPAAETDADRVADPAGPRTGPTKGHPAPASGRP
jgi:DNA-binding MarR family transcriptional regulator